MEHDSDNIFLFSFHLLDLMLLSWTAPKGLTHVPQRWRCLCEWGGMRGGGRGCDSEWVAAAHWNYTCGVKTWWRGGGHGGGTAAGAGARRKYDD